jgi:hypothetical protein
MDLSMVLECSGLGHLSGVFEGEELDLESFRLLDLIDLNELPIDEADRDPLMNLIGQLSGGTQGEVAMAAAAAERSAVSKPPATLPSPPRSEHDESADEEFALAVSSMVELGLSVEVSEAALRRCCSSKGDGSGRGTTSCDVHRAVDLAFEHGGDLEALLLLADAPATLNSSSPVPAASPTIPPPTANTTVPTSANINSAIVEVGSTWAAASAAPLGRGRGLRAAQPASVPIGVVAPALAADPAPALAVPGGWATVVASAPSVNTSSSSWSSKFMSEKKKAFPTLSEPTSHHHHERAVELFVRSCGLGGDATAASSTLPASTAAFTAAAASASPATVASASAAAAANAVAEAVKGGAAVVVIMRGLPGAGKSTLTRHLKQAAEADGREVAVCSADKVIWSCCCWNWRCFLAFFHTTAVEK